VQEVILCGSFEEGNKLNQLSWVLKENTKDTIQELRWMSLNYIWMSGLYLFFILFLIY